MSTPLSPVGWQIIISCDNVCPYTSYDLYLSRHHAFTGDERAIGARRVVTMQSEIVYEEWRWVGHHLIT